MVKQLSVGANQGQLCGGGAGVNAKKALAFIGFQLLLSHNRPAVAALKFREFHFVPEQRLQTGHLKSHRYPLFQLFNQPSQGHGFPVLCFQRRAHGGEQVGVFRVHGGFVRQF